MGLSRARPLPFLLAAAAIGPVALACGALIELPPAEEVADENDASIEAAAPDGAPPDAALIDAGPDASEDLCAASPSPCVKLWEPDGGSEYPFGIGTMKDHVYWVAQSSGSAPYDGNGTAKVRRVRKVVGSAAELIADEQPRGRLLTLSPSRVFWSVKALQVNGERLTIRAVTPSSSCPPSCSQVYWFADRNADVTHLAAAPSSGLDSPELVATSDEHETFALVGAPASLALVRLLSGTGGHGAAANDDGVFALRDVDVDRISAIGAATRFGSLSEIARVFGGGPHRLWALLQSWKLVGARTDGTGDPKDPFNLSPAASVPQADWSDLVADDAYVYLGAMNGGGILRIDVATGAVSYVKKNESAWYLAVDDDGLYWGSHGKDGSAGAIWMMRKRP